MSDEPKLRKVFVLRQVEVPWSELKKGDVFRLEPVDTYNDPNEWSVAVTDAEPQPPPMHHCVRVERLRTEQDTAPFALMPPIMEKS